MPNQLYVPTPVLSFGAKRSICFFSALLFPFLATLVSAQTATKRPKITGIDNARIYVTDVDKPRKFYSNLFGVRLKGGMCFDSSRSCFTIGWAHDQTIDIEQAPTVDTGNL